MGLRGCFKKCVSSVCLYMLSGNLPPSSRKQQAEMFNSNADRHSSDFDSKIGQGLN